ncbi:MULTISPECIES: hypothetical protein [Methylobacterium]|jgi:hypothetical protein|uniref:hypothetical protein n=1 Tax=Methylobacterium TaxID=407 RepID=UPI0011C958B7|nr:MULTISPECIES: hypothetical protein [Methylobacterium]TXN44434.1 hypothetical protein FV233_14855 [Methylobacterium sp. WL7]GJE21205.1 hypothetical protein JHFBIEKO_1647 [Methylobacterium mesophilicum]
MVRLLLTATILAGGAAALVTPAAALSTKDCSTKYQAAKQAGTLNGQKWNDFRKAECGAEATNTTANTVPNPVAPGATKPAAPAPAPQAPAARPTAAPAGTAAYPSAVDPKYASESAGKARMHTCLDSYNAAKAAGTLGDAKWIQKGGGYYSVCNKRLKG